MKKYIFMLSMHDPYQIELSFFVNVLLHVKIAVFQLNTVSQ